jgi:hypothetical protein
MAEQTFTLDTDQASPTILPIGTTKKAVAFAIRVNEEQYRKIYPEVNFYKLNRVETVVDDLYKEAVGDAVYDGLKQTDGTTVGAVEKIPALIQQGPQMKLLKRYGIEEEQEAIAVFAASMLHKRGIEVHTGDRIEFLAITWEVIKPEFTDYFANSQVPLNLVCTLKNAEPL